MTGLTASVIIASRKRPDQLALCLTAVGQLLHPSFEIVVVADSDSLARLPPDLATRIKTRAFDEANISAARNQGIALAAGDILAFVDDDATPEPTWLARLCAPFADPQVASAGGYVRGRNGISMQWTGRMVDAFARHQALPDAPAIIGQHAGLALKTEGTCMAHRRDVLRAAGGFDPGFRFYLDETDLNLRLAATEAKAALVPLAQVHHAFAASERRRADRVPQSLHDIGASLALFLRRHAGRPDPIRLKEEAEERRTGLAAHVRAGRIGQEEASRLIDSLDAGWDEGLTRTLALPRPIADAPPPFKPWRREGAGRHRIFSGHPRNRRRLMRAAEAAARSGDIVSLHLFSLTPRRHRIAFQPGGFWLQEGGLYGASLRHDPALRLWRRKSRVAREAALVAGLRQLDPDFPTIVE